MPTTYEYCGTDRLEARNTYFYSAFHGETLLADWRDARGCFGDLLDEAPEGERSAWPEPDSEFELGPLLEHAFAVVSAESELGATDGRWLSWLVKKFEVSKRLFPVYGADLKAVDREDYRHLELYVRYAEVVARAYSHGEDLRFLNVLLKVMDTLTSVVAQLDVELHPRVAGVAAMERRFVETLAVSVAGRAA